MDDRHRYALAAHAMQSGVAAEMGFDPKPTEPKHLRVGINAAMSDIGGLATLLIAKGVITEAEYLAAIADAMEREKDKYEQMLSARYGGNVTLA
ncbi:MAG: hypothetical protein ABTQ31_17185 [Rhizobiaceae bacterium]